MESRENPSSPPILLTWMRSKVTRDASVAGMKVAMRFVNCLVVYSVGFQPYCAFSLPTLLLLTVCVFLGRGAGRHKSYTDPCS